MAQIIIKAKIFPEDINIDIEKLKNEVIKAIQHFQGYVDKFETEDVAFGLKALIFVFLIDDKKTDTDVVEDNLRNLEGVGNVEIMDIRRALG